MLFMHLSFFVHPNCDGVPFEYEVVEGTKCEYVVQRANSEISVDIDDKNMNNVNKGGRRIHLGLDIKKSIVNMYEVKDSIKNLVNMLSSFVL